MADYVCLVKADCCSQHIFLSAIYCKEFRGVTHAAGIGTSVYFVISHFIAESSSQMEVQYGDSAMGVSPLFVSENGTYDSVKRKREVRILKMHE